jgi:putative DNA primase/helicase
MLWRGKHTGLGGDPGLGKSVLALDIAARQSRGGQVSPYSAETFPPGNTLILSSEDGAADTIVPRLRVAGADMHRVKILSGIFTDGLLDHPNLGRHLIEISAAIRDHDARLVIIDPITSFLGRIDGNSQTDVRGVVDPLNAMLEATGCALLSVQHLNKSANSKAIYRLGGSIAFAGAPRAVFGFVRDETAEDAKTARLLLPVKVNLIREPDGFGLSLVDCGGYPRVQWNAERSVVAIDDALNPPPERKPAKALRALREFMADGRERTSAEVFEALESHFGERSIYEALRVCATRRKTKDGHTFYTLRGGPVECPDF